MKPHYRFGIFLLSSLLCLFAIGCGTNKSSCPQCGNWVATLSVPGTPGGQDIQTLFAFTGELTWVTGVARFDGFPCISSNEAAKATGTLDGSYEVGTFPETWTAPTSQGTVLTINGNENDKFSAFNGTFSLKGTGCETVNSGSVVASKYMPLSGNYLGSLNTTQGNSLILLSSLQQSNSPDQAGQYQVSGSLSITPAQCISNPKLQNSFVLGNTFSSTFIGSDQTQLTISGTYTQDATIMNVTTFSVSGGTCDGLKGSGTMTQYQAEMSPTPAIISAGH